MEIIIPTSSGNTNNIWYRAQDVAYGRYQLDEKTNQRQQQKYSMFPLHLKPADFNYYSFNRIRVSEFHHSFKYLLSHHKQDMVLPVLS